MGFESLHNNMTAGELDPRLHARSDLAKYQHGVAVAENMIILPYGGLRRRQGLSKTPSSKLMGKTRIVPFMFNSEQTYVIALRDKAIDIYKNGVKVSTEVTTYLEIDLFDIDIIQSADTMIFAHQSYPPSQLQRQGSDTAWEFKSIVFTKLPYYNFGTVIIQDFVNSGSVQTVSIAVGQIVLNRDGDNTKGLNYTYYKCKVAITSTDLSTVDFSVTANWEQIGSQEIAWSETRGYPRTCTFYQQRLWFAGTTQLPTTIWGSKTSGFFDFDLDDGDADDAIEDTLDSDQYDVIQQIFTGRSLQVFTSCSEFVNTSKIITPSDSTWQRQTGYGCSKIRPVLIDGATLFIDSSNRTVRQFLYDYNENGWVSLNASLLSSHLITKAKALDVIKGTLYDIGDYVYVVNEDGSLAVLNTMRAEEVSGWTHWTTEGKFEDVAVVGKEVYFVVQRNEERFLEKLVENTYTDHNVVLNGIEPPVSSLVVDGSLLMHGVDSVVHTNIALGTPIHEVQTNYDAAFLNTEFKVITDFSIQDEQKPEGVSENNKFTLPRAAYRAEIGLNFTTKVTTLPLATETQKGNTLHRRKRVVKVDLNVFETLGVYARNYFSGNRKFTVVLDKAPEPFTGFKEMYLLGYDRLAEIEITQKEPLPFTLRGLVIEVEY